MEGLKH